MSFSTASAGNQIKAIKPHKFGFAAFLGCLLVPLVFLVVIKPNMSPMTVGTPNCPRDVLASEGGHPSLFAVSSFAELRLRKITTIIEEFTRTSAAEEPTELPKEMERKQLPLEKAEATINDETMNHPISRFECDTSEPRTDVCEMQGDVRIDGKISTIALVASTTSVQNLTSWNIRPYARKWESPTMSLIKDLSLRSSPGSEEAPECSMNHGTPAVVFSTGGFQGNFFHELTDVLLPLFLTSHQYNGEVQFLIVDYKPWWVKKYQNILRQLSRYEPIDLDSDSRVHCFPRAVVGLRSHRELGIDPLKIPLGYSMLDFTQFLRSSYSLKREYVRRDTASARKPRLIIMSRKRSRSMLNEREVVRMARGLGFKVLVAGPELAKNLSRFAATVNSCDVMMGVHGAGLSNMVFLPSNATVVQIVPWGEMKWACRFAFGDPAEWMGLRYIEYEIGQEESSLIHQYPRDHAVFKDPLSIHRQGFNAMWSTFLDKQNVTLDVGRFRSILLDVLQSW